MSCRARFGGGVVLLIGMAWGGCVDPKGTEAERRAADAAGAGYARPRAERERPDLSAGPLSADDLLRHAFLANPSLEAAYHRWRQALARVTQAAAWGDPEFSFAYLTSSGRMRTWDRTTLGATQTVPTAGKRSLRARAALAEAVAARHAFEQRKFDIQREVLSAAADYAFLGEALDIHRENARFLRYLAALAAARQKVGLGRQQDLLRAQVALESGENDLAELETRHPQEAARLNALLGRDAALPLPFPQWRGPSDIPASDAEILALAAERNPALAALAAEARARQDALAYARRLWVPDFTLGAEVMGDVESKLMAMFMLPVQWPRLRAMVREAEGALAEAEARLLAAGDDVRVRTVIALSAARDARRQTRLYEKTILPKAEQALVAAIAGYGAGGAAAGSFLDVIDSQRMVLMLRLAAARARAAQEKALADLEAILAVDRAAWGPKTEKEAGHEAD